MKKGVHFEVKEKEHTCNLTDAGVREAEKLAGVESFYTAGNMEWPHLMDNALKAHYLYKRDVNYVVEGGRGHHRRRIHRPEDGRPPVERRPAPGGRGQGRGADQGRDADAGHDHAAELLQALQEARRHDRHGQTEAEEFCKIYQLDVVTIPTNRPMRRRNAAGRVFRTEREKWDAVIDEIGSARDGPAGARRHRLVEKARCSATSSSKYGIEHEVLNAK